MNSGLVCSSSSSGFAQAKAEFGYVGEHPKAAVRKFRNAALDALATASAIGVALHGMAATLPSMFPARASGRWVYDNKPVVVPACAVTWLPVPKRSVASLLPRAWPSQDGGVRAALASAGPPVSNADLGVLLGGASGQLKARARQEAAVVPVTVVEVVGVEVAEVEAAAVVEQSPRARRPRMLPAYASPPLFTGREHAVVRERGGASKPPPPVGLRRAGQSGEGGSAREGSGVGIVAPKTGRVSGGSGGGVVSAGMGAGTRERKGAASVRCGKGGGEGTVVAARGRKVRGGGGLG